MELEVEACRGCRDAEGWIGPQDDPARMMSTVLQKEGVGEACHADYVSGA